MKLIVTLIVTYYHSRLDTQININFFTFFFQPSIRMSGKNINFDDKKISRCNFYKNKKLFIIHDLDAYKILVSKKESYGKKIHLNTLLDIIMMLLDHYV